MKETTSKDVKWLRGHLEFGRKPTAVVPTTNQVRPMQASNILQRVKHLKLNTSLLSSSPFFIQPLISLSQKRADMPAVVRWWVWVGLPERREDAVSHKDAEAVHQRQLQADVVEVVVGAGQ